MTYRLNPDFERTAILLCLRSKAFWLRLGNRINPDELDVPLHSLALRLCRASAADHGWPEEDLVIQRASLWLNEGSATEADLMALGDLLEGKVELDPDRVIEELIPPVRLAWSQAITRKVLDRYKNGGRFGPSLIEELVACDELGKPVSQAEIKSPEFGEDTEAVLENAPVGIRIKTGFEELDMLFRGGWPLGTLLTLLADSKGSKSMTACYMTACAILQGENAGYLSLELPASEIHKRILAAIAGATINDLEDSQNFKDALRLFASMRKQRRIGRLFIEKLEAGTVDTLAVASWFRFQEQARDLRIRFRVVDYGDLVISPNRNDQDSGYNTGKVVWQALANMAQDKEAPNWVLTPTQSKRPEWKVGQPIPMLTRTGLADSIHKLRITDFLITLTAQPDLRAEAGHIIYVDADRFFGQTGVPIGPVPHERAMGRMASMAYLIG